MERPINLDDRYQSSNSPSSLTPAQEKFLQKLREIAKLPDKTGKGKKEKRLAAASGVAKTLLELLPDTPSLAIIYAELKEANKETISQIRELFDFKLHV